MTSQSISSISDKIIPLDNFTSCKDNVRFEDGKMREVMEGMDQELHGSSMSKSFKKKVCCLKRS